MEISKDTKALNARVFIVGLCIITLALLSFVLFVDRIQNKTLKVVFFDVGQGDAIWIETPGGVQVLIDGGRDRSVMRALSGEMSFFDRSIDMVVATHEDADHVGGLPEVFDRYDVDTFLRTENQGEGTAAKRIDSINESSGSDVVYARTGMNFDLGTGVFLSVVFPDRNVAGLETNTSSIILKLVYGSSEFLLTGDSPDEIEKYLVAGNVDLVSDVLKLGHHGSKTSTSEEFLERVNPVYVVVSAGKDNSYGHPHPEVTQRVAAQSVELLSTIEEGSIVFLTDGTNLRHTKRWWH